MRGVLHALAEEEERRAVVEGRLELSAKEAESAWRAELLALYRETAARVQRLSTAQAARYQQLEASMEAAAADQRPESVAQLELLTNLAVETRSQVRPELTLTLTPARTLTLTQTQTLALALTLTLTLTLAHHGLQHGAAVDARTVR